MAEEKRETLETGNEDNSNPSERQQQIVDMGSATIKTDKGTIHTLTIVGQIEGHQILPPTSKSTKYEHVMPLLAAVEESDDVDGLLVLLNTVGGDIEAGLGIAELISSMSKPTVSIIVQLAKFETLKKALNDIGVTGMTVTQVMGCGLQKGSGEKYRGAEVDATLLPKVKVEVVVSKIPVDKIIDTATKALYTGHIGDGKIFVYNVAKVVKVRTGEQDYAALQDVE